MKRLDEILEFYANKDNYWSAPLLLENKYCQRTLHDVRESEKCNLVLEDRGSLAREGLKLAKKYLETQEVGASILRYIGDGKFQKDLGKYPNDLGTSDFMEKHYHCLSTFPSYNIKDIGVLLTHYELRSEFSGKLPPHVIDLAIGNGDILCFQHAWEVAEYINSMLPLIEYHKKWMGTED